MTREGSVATSSPCPDQRVSYGRGDWIRTSGPCLPNALRLAAPVDLRCFFVQVPCSIMLRVPASLLVGRSRRTFAPCAFIGVGSA